MEQVQDEMLKRIEALESAIKQTQDRLQEAEEALRAIRAGEVDALVVYSHEGEKIYTLEGADYTYRMMIEAINEGAANIDETGTVLYSNRRLADMLGVPLDQLLGRAFTRFVEPSDLPAFEALLAQGIQESSRAEITLVDRTGHSMPVLLSMSRVDIKGSPSAGLVVTDLTEQKRNEAIQASERMARSILDQAAETIIVCDAEGRIERCSQGTFKLAGQNPLYKPFQAVFPLLTPQPVKVDQLFSIQSVLRGQSYKAVEAMIDHHHEPGLSSDGPCWVLASATPLRDDEGQIQGAIVHMTNITDRKAAEISHLKNEIMARENRAQIEVQRRLIEQREKERQQIARDLHDGPVQEILGNIFILQPLIQETDGSLRETLTGIYQSLQGQVNDLRAFSSELRPPLLMQFGLEKAIQAHQSQFLTKHPHIQVHLEFNDGGAQEPENIRVALFRIYQEAMNNVIRHSQASHVTIRFWRAQHQAILELEDDGIGFTPPEDWMDPVREGHLGLAGMRERAEAASGTLEVLSQPGHGTRLRATINLK